MLSWLWAIEPATKGDDMKVFAGIGATATGLAAMGLYAPTLLALLVWFLFGVTWFLLVFSKMKPEVRHDVIYLVRGYPRKPKQAS